jgi:hypothetical protein
MEGGRERKDCAYCFSTSPMTLTLYIVSRLIHSDVKIAIQRPSLHENARLHR